MPKKNVLNAHQKENLFKWLDQHPEILDRIAQLKQIAEAGPDQLNRLEQAESSVIEQVYGLGSDVLGQWAQEKQQQASEHELQVKNTRRHKKKA